MFEIKGERKTTEPQWLLWEQPTFIEIGLKAKLLWDHLTAISRIILWELVPSQPGAM